MSGFRLRARLGFSHTRLLSRPARNYPRLRIQRSSSERRGDFNPHDSRAAQRTLRVCPTSSGRPSSAYVLGLPDAAHGAIRRGRPPGSPGSRAWCFRTRTGSLTARSPARQRIAIPTPPVWPSDSSYCVGAPEGGLSRLNTPARTYPCRRLSAAFADGWHGSAAGVVSSSVAGPFWFVASACRLPSAAWPMRTVVAHRPPPRIRTGGITASGSCLR